MVTGGGAGHMANQGGTSGENAGIAKLSGGKNGGDCDGTAACIDGVCRAELEDPLLSSVARNLREISATSFSALLRFCPLPIVHARLRV
jgi:hypothetical protein